MASAANSMQRQPLVESFLRMLQMEDATWRAFALEREKRLKELRALDRRVSVCSWREVVAQSFYDLIDHLGQNRELAYIAMNILDRYTLCSYPSEEYLYEVEAMCALYLAIRIASSGTLALSQLVALSRNGRIKEKDIVDLGSMMISSLSWNRRLLSPGDFVRFLMISMAPPKYAHDSLMDSTMYLVEIAVFDQTLARVRPSHLAVAAFITAINELDTVHQIEKADLLNQMNALTSAVNFCDMSEISQRLRLIRNHALTDHNVEDLLPHVIPDEEDTEEDISCVDESFESLSSPRS